MKCDFTIFGSVQKEQEAAESSTGSEADGDCQCHRAKGCCAEAKF